MTHAILFRAEGDFRAQHDATELLTAAGFSVGSFQAGASTGFLHGRYAVQKWRDLNAAERRGLHGTLTGDARRGPITATLHDDAPREARLAFARVAAVVAGLKVAA